MKTRSPVRAARRWGGTRDAAARQGSAIRGRPRLEAQGGSPVGNVPAEVVQPATQTRPPDDLLLLSPEAMPVFRGRIMARLLRSLISVSLPCVPIVQRPRTWPFQGQNMGSNPVGDATFCISPT